MDLLLALSLRVREVLLARLQRLRQGDLFFDPSASNDLTPEERLGDLAEELAEDAATAMWTFACVKACTGMRSVPLFETCSSILCQNVVEMRKRAQAADYDEPGVALGTNDIVDRLAQSEKAEEKPTPPEQTNESDKETAQEESTEKDALLDWLSPCETNDVLWAIALHGSVNSTSASDDEVELSETVAALREIAFDRMMDWLEHDLVLSSPVEKADEISTQSVMNGDTAVTVEVVDAAALLALQSQSKEEVSGESIPVENLILEAHGAVEEVKVVDAAALLASVSDDSGHAAETEVIQAPMMMNHDTEVPKDKNPAMVEKRESTEQNFPKNSRKPSTFSLHDLATMAWSATELRDPLRIKIVGMVITLIERLGLHSMTLLTGGDLANLAWAISKYDEQLSEKVASRPNPLSITVLSWIAHTSLRKGLDNLHSEQASHINVLKSFQPPELGRLVWAIANTMSTHAEIPLHIRRSKEIIELARLSLEAAASNMALFATEDLVRFTLFAFSCAFQCS